MFRVRKSSLGTAFPHGPPRSAGEMEAALTLLQQQQQQRSSDGSDGSHQPAAAANAEASSSAASETGPYGMSLLALLLPYLYQHTLLNLVTVRHYALRSALIGNERLQREVLAGYTPEQLREKIAGVDELARLLRTHVTHALRDQALGYAAEVLASTMVAAAGAEDAEAELVQRLLAGTTGGAGAGVSGAGTSGSSAGLWAYLSRTQDPDIVDLTRDALDRGALVRWVAEQKRYGDLQGDVAWEDSGNKQKHRWENRLGASVKWLEESYSECCGLACLLPGY